MAISAWADFGSREDVARNPIESQGGLLRCTPLTDGSAYSSLCDTVTWQPEAAAPAITSMSNKVLATLSRVFSPSKLRDPQSVDS